MIGLQKNHWTTALHHLLLFIFLIPLIDWSKVVESFSSTSFVNVVVPEGAEESSMMRLPTKIRVVSYNVLSSHLATPASYPTYPVEHLEPSQRLKKVLQKLENEIKSDQQRPTIICLQEVSYDWAGALHTFFAGHKYHVVTGLYGKSFNGYMGILTAYPIEPLETVHVDICRLSDTYAPEWPKPVAESSFQKFSKGWLQYFNIIPPEKESHWSCAERRYNVLLSIILKDRTSQQEFVVGNYHMPCVYYDERVMILHSDLCLSHVQKIAEHSVSSSVSNAEVEEEPVPPRRPYILAGDFNIKPVDAAYRLLTTGAIDPNDPAFPTGGDWQPRQREPVRSAYALHNQGQEPDCTNYSRCGAQEDCFIDTLDYIFVASDSVQVTGVTALSPREDLAGPLPNADEPSDHLLIAADVEIVEVKD
jgi:2',5'-phosphodiesterase